MNEANTELTTGIVSTPSGGSVRASYYLHAAVLGMLAGVGCVACFGAIGGIAAAVALGGWGVIEAIKKEEATNDQAQRPPATNPKS